MFESLACGTPFVGTKVGGIQEIVNSRDYGMLVETGNSKALAEALKDALSKVWDRDEISKYACQFTWAKKADKVLHLYEQLDLSALSIRASIQ